MHEDSEKLYFIFYFNFAKDLISNINMILADHTKLQAIFHDKDLNNIFN
jgi:hypothetical protein